MTPRNTHLVRRFIKNLFLYGSLAIIISIAIDWYRKPSVPTHFAQQVYTDLNGQPKLIAQLSADKPMLIYFWGSWCHYCEFVSPNIQQLAENGTNVLGVALKSGSADEVKQYLADNRYTFSTFNDPSGEFSKGWGIQATPTLLIIKDGKLISHTTGYTSYLGLQLRLWLAQFSV